MIINVSGYDVLIDESDLDFFYLHKWYVHISPAKNKYLVASSNELRNQRFHRQLMKPQDGMVVDHINGNTLDNRRSNLRLATRKQNNAAKHRLVANKTSRFKGVQVSKSPKGWKSRVGRTWLGYFKSEIEAAKAYDVAAVEMFGEFAVTNKMLGLLD